MSLFDWILRIFTVWKGFFSLLVCLVASGLLVSLDPGERRTFHDVMISTFLYPAQAILSKLNRDIFIYKQNEELKRVNTALRLENDRLVQAIRRVPRLEEFDAFDSTSGLNLRMAQISAEDPGRFSTNWVVNLGRQDSVDVNMPVLTWKGLVGRTAKCFRRHCLVQGLGDPSCKVSVLVNRSRVSGMLESWPGGRLVARFPRDADIGEGDTLVTTGMGGVYPKGLMVGQALGGTRDMDDMGDILRAVEVRPFQNPYLLEEVFVLVRRDSWVVGEE